MKGTEKQVQWAGSIIDEALSSVNEVAAALPEYGEACDRLAELLCRLEDAAWIISTRHTLGLKIRDGKLDMDALHNHQLFRDERWRNPNARIGRGGIDAVSARAVKLRFLEAANT